MVVCQCHRVTSREALTAAESGCHHVRDVVRTTKAGTDCGGCIPQLRALCEEWRRTHETTVVPGVDHAVA